MASRIRRVERKEWTLAKRSLYIADVSAFLCPGGISKATVRSSLDHLPEIMFSLIKQSTKISEP